MIDLNFKVRYRIGDIVYCRSDVDSRLRFVTGYIIRKGTQKRNCNLYRFNGRN